MNRHRQTGTHSSWLTVVIAPLLTIAPGHESAAAPHRAAPTASADQDDTERARLLGLLIYTQVTMSIHGIPARDVIDMFRQTTGIPIVARWNDDAVGFGLEPRTLVTLDVIDKPALDVLEEILAQCEVYEDCTWQLRKGFVEVSTKQRLAVPGARETRLYDIRHLMIEPPMFAPAGNGSETPVELKYASAFTSRRNAMVRQDNGEYILRKTPQQLADEVVTLVVETIEPGLWDLGEGESDDRADELKEPPTSASPAPAAPSAAQPAQPLPRARTGVGKWATLRVWRDQFVIKAPDFMHRQVNGYPKAIKPEGDLHRTYDPNARGAPQDPDATFDESKDAGRPVTPAPGGDGNPPTDASAPQRPGQEPIDPPKSPGDRKKPSRP